MTLKFLVACQQEIRATATVPFLWLFKPLVHGDTEHVVQINVSFEWACQRTPNLKKCLALTWWQTGMSAKLVLVYIYIYINLKGWSLLVDSMSSRIHMEHFLQVFNAYFATIFRSSFVDDSSSNIPFGLSFQVWYDPSRDFLLFLSGWDAFVM